MKQQDVWSRAADMYVKIDAGGADDASRAEKSFFHGTSEKNYAGESWITRKMPELICIVSASGSHSTDL